jgi:hypothetical protein
MSHKVFIFLKITLLYCQFQTLEAGSTSEKKITGPIGPRNIDPRSSGPILKGVGGVCPPKKILVLFGKNPAI